MEQVSLWGRSRHALRASVRRRRLSDLRNAPARGSVAAGVAVGGTALLLGAIATRTGSAPYLLAALLAIAVGALLFAGRVFEVLVAWVALEGIAYPFVRYPLHHNLGTFDRLVVPALGGAVLLQAWPRMTTVSRRLVIAAGAFSIVFGLRAFLTKVLPLPPNYGAVSFIVSAYQPEANWLDEVAIPFIVLVAAARTVTRDRWESVAKALTFLGVTVAALGLLEWVAGFQLATLSGFSPFIDQGAGVVRVGGPYGDPSTYGGVLVICLAATIYFMESRRAYLVGGSALFIEVLGLVPSFTKTIWGAGFVTVVIALGFRARGRSRTIRTALVASLIVGTAYTLVQNSPVVAERVRGSNSNVIARLGDYEQGVLIFRHWPLFGAGVDQFISAQQFVRPVYVDGVVATPSAHNTFISVLAELGLTGFIPLVLLGAAIIMTLSALFRQLHSRRDMLFATTVLAGAVGYLLISLTLVEIDYPPSTTLLALILGAAAARLNTVGGEPRRGLTRSSDRVSGLDVHQARYPALPPRFQRMRE